MQTQPASPSSAQPAFDPKNAPAVTPYRHAKTGRTVARHQADKDTTHLFSPTGVYIASVATKDAEAAATQAAADAKAARDSAQQANDTEHQARVDEAAAQVAAKTAASADAAS